MQNPSFPPSFSDSPSGAASRHIHECMDCGFLSRLETPVPGTNMGCPRCGNVLRRVQKNSHDYALAWALAGAFFYMLTVTSPMLQIGIYGRTRSGSIESSAFALDNQGYWLLSAVVLLTTVVLPATKIAGCLLVQWGLRAKQTPSWLSGLYAFMKHLKPWVMIEVYLLGFLVAYSRLQLIATVHLTTAVVGLCGLMVAIVAMDAYDDEEAIWEQIAPRRPVDPALRTNQVVACDTCAQVLPLGACDHCPRCGEILHHRKPDSLRRAWALTIAAAILYAPSNAYPIMDITKLGKTQSYTIYGGLMELAHVGLLPLAALVFIASIAIPVFKLIALAFMMIQTHRAAKTKLRTRTRLYRLIDFIGRWSMVDIFVVSILVALVHFGWFTQITADIGAVFFAGVVVLTLLAVQAFDPRLMWDAAAKPSSDSLSSSLDLPHDRSVTAS